MVNQTQSESDSNNNEELFKYLEYSDSINYVMLYNDLKKNGKLNTGLDDIITNYDKLFDFGLSMSGFQFIGLVLENSALADKSISYKLSFFSLALGFLFSLFGSTIAYAIVKYLRSIKQENDVFILSSIYQYNSILYMGILIPFFNSGLFLLSMNMLIYNGLDFYFGILFNTISFITFIIGIYVMYTIMFKEQVFKIYTENETKRLKFINSNQI